MEKGDEQMIKLPDEATNINLHIRLLKTEEVVQRIEHSIFNLSNKTDEILKKLDERDEIERKRIRRAIIKHSKQCKSDVSIGTLVSTPIFQKVFFGAAIVGTVIAGLVVGFGGGQLNSDKIPKPITNGQSQISQQK